MMDKPVDRRASDDNGVVSAKEPCSARTDEITPDQIKALKEGDLSVFNRLFYEFRQPISRFVEPLLHSAEDAAEITQDLFSDLWINRHMLDEKKKMTSYLFAMARNKAVTHLRQRVVHHKFMDHQAVFNPGTVESPEEILSGRELDSLVREAIERMPEQRRTAYKLSREEGMTYDEIAQTMGLAKGTVQTHIKLAIQEMKKVVGRITSVVLL